MNANLLILLAFVISVNTNTKFPPHQAQKIIGGKEAFPRQFPSLVQIYGKFGEFKEFLHVGTVIKENYILTTTTWFIKRATNLTVEYGTNKFNQTNSSNVEFTIIEERLTLLKLITPIKLGQEVIAVTLPEENENVNVGTNGTCPSWGDWKNFNLLQYDNLTIYETRTCINDWFGYNISEFFCAGNDIPNSAPKTKDIGAPFMIANKQLGILFDFTLDVLKIPKSRLFLRLSAFIAWIKENTDDDSSSSSTEDDS